MKPGDRICILGGRKSPTGFMIYATNVMPLNVSIPDSFTDDEARDTLFAVATIYERVRQRLIVENEANENLLRELWGPEPAQRPNPTIEQMVAQALGIREG